MIATVTTTTLAASTYASSLAITVTFVLIVFVVLRELAVTVGPRSRLLARFLPVAIAPVLVVFAATVVKHLADLV